MADDNTASFSSGGSGAGDADDAEDEFGSRDSRDLGDTFGSEDRADDSTAADTSESTGGATGGSTGGGDDDPAGDDDDPSGSDPAAGESVTTYDGEKTFRSGPQHTPDDPTDRKVTLDEGGDEGPRPSEGDPDADPDYRPEGDLGVEDQPGRGNFGGDGSARDQAVQRLQGRIDRQVPGVLAIETDEYNITRRGNQYVATLSESGYRDAVATARVDGDPGGVVGDDRDPDPGPTGGSSAASGPGGVDGRKTTIIGPGNAWNPTNDPLAVVEDRAGDEGARVFPRGDDPLVADTPEAARAIGQSVNDEQLNRLGLQDTVGGFTTVRRGPEGDPQVIGGVRSTSVVPGAEPGAADDQAELAQDAAAGTPARRELPEQVLQRLPEREVAVDAVTQRARAGERVDTAELASDAFANAGNDVYDRAERAQDRFAARQSRRPTEPGAGDRQQQGIQGFAVDAIRDPRLRRAASAAAARQSLRRQGYNPAAFRVEGSPSGEASVDLRSPGEFDASLGLGGPGDEVERFLDERLPAAGGRAADAIGLDVVRQRLRDAPTPATGPRGTSPAAAGQRFGESAFRLGEDLVQLPGKALEATEAANRVAEPVVVSPVGLATGADRVPTQRSAGQAASRAEDTAVVVGALGTAAATQAQKRPRGFASDVLVGSVGEAVAFGSVGSVSRIPTPDVDVSGAARSAASRAGEVRSRTPDVDVVRDSDAGVVDVSPMLRRQVRQGVRERLPSGRADTTTADVFGRPLRTEQRTSVSERSAASTADVGRAGRGPDVPAARDVVDSAALSVRGAAARVRDAPTQARRRARENAPVGGDGADLDLPEAADVRDSALLSARGAAARVREAPVQARRRAREAAPTGALAVGLGDRSIRESTVLSARGAVARARDVTTQAQWRARENAPVGGAVGGAGGGRLRDLTVRIGPIRPERIDAGRIPDDINDPQGPFAGDEVSDLPNTFDVLDIDDPAARRGPGDTADVRVEVDEGQAAVLRRRPPGDRRGADADVDGVRDRSDTAGVFAAVAPANRVEPDAGVDVGVSDPVERALGDLGESETPRVEPTPGAEVGAGVASAARSEVGEAVDGRGETRLDTRIDSRLDSRVDSRRDFRMDTRLDSRFDVRGDLRLDVRGDARVDARVDIPDESDIEDPFDGVEFGGEDEVFDTGVVQTLDELENDQNGADAFGNLDDLL